jgi:hypothetical protein
MKLYDKIRNTLKQYIPSKYLELKNLFLLYKNNTKKESKLILIQCIKDFFYFTTFVKIASNSSLDDIIVKQYIARNFNISSHYLILRLLKSSIYSNCFTNIKWVKLYSSFYSDVTFRNKENIEIIIDIKLFFQAYLKESILSKK